MGCAPSKPTGNTCQQKYCQPFASSTSPGSNNPSFLPPPSPPPTSPVSPPSAPPLTPGRHESYSLPQVFTDVASSDSSDSPHTPSLRSPLAVQCTTHKHRMPPPLLQQKPDDDDEGDLNFDDDDAVGSDVVESPASAGEQPLESPRTMSKKEMLRRVLEERRRLSRQDADAAITEAMEAKGRESPRGLPHHHSRGGSLKSPLRQRRSGSIASGGGRRTPVQANDSFRRCATPELEEVNFAGHSQCVVRFAATPTSPVAAGPSAPIASAVGATYNNNISGASSSSLVPPEEDDFLEEFIGIPRAMTTTTTVTTAANSMVKGMSYAEESTTHNVGGGWNASIAGVPWADSTTTAPSALMLSLSQQLQQRQHQSQQMEEEGAAAGEPAAVSSSKEDTVSANNLTGTGDTTLSAISGKEEEEEEGGEGEAAVVGGNNGGGI